MVAPPTLMSPSSSVPSNRFIAGGPMSPATKTFAGRSYNSVGESNCCSCPARITATRSPIVMASTWSWVR